MSIIIIFFFFQNGFDERSKWSDNQRSNGNNQHFWMICFDGIRHHCSIHLNYSHGKRNWIFNDDNSKMCLKITMMFVWFFFSVHWSRLLLLLFFFCARHFPCEIVRFCLFVMNRVDGFRINYSDCSNWCRIDSATFKSGD